MQFRTEIEKAPKGLPQIPRNDGIFMIGSCFTDNIGALLKRDGFNVVHNPMGPLYNPDSISKAVSLAMFPAFADTMIVETDSEGKYHCLDFASRYCADTRDALDAKVNADLDVMRDALLNARTVIITLGTAFVYSLTSRFETVGNCHKFPAGLFNRQMLSVSETESRLRSIISMIPLDVERVFFTVSPVRHTADTLHGNQLSKATLLLAVERIIASDPKTHYFPAYEIVNDDLRDYRFYAADLKHPSEVAVEYIYQCFSERHFSEETRRLALLSRKQAARDAHRPIIE